MNSFFVYGVPTPKGSAKALRGVPFGKPCPACHQSKRGHPRVFSDNSNLKGWEQAIRGASRASKNVEKIVGPVEIHLAFHMPRLKSHYRTGKYSHLLKDSAPFWHTTKPDIDKLERAVFDGLTNICYGDDATVAKNGAIKFYSDTPGVLIEYGEAQRPCSLKTQLDEHSQAELPGLAGTKTLAEST
jgi:crossover junction endodeoxyribonuclease RusA